MKALNTEKLSIEIKNKLVAENVSCRKAAKDNGIAPSVLLRTSKGSQPDGNNLVKILDWLQMPLKDFEINV